ncbi:LacI family DNA-binding transcriptional regulator [uncultured Martelella sp.]|uniref:LacI family DNA-binding transcriptional regulator n=1 Tax=uncultured Martelella sp. TaxID=392331 RepID=UPI0029C6DF01|nr:LacI family DNA-binding transcriptional regulator [uncultured Martelella sp.]
MSSKDEKGPTLKDVADAAGVSVAVASKVLNRREGVSQASRDRVMQTANTIGYRARSRRASSSLEFESVTVVTLDRYVTDNPFHSEVIDGILAEAREEGLSADVRVISAESAAKGDPAQLWQNRPASVILVGIDNSGLLDAIYDAQIPTVIVNGMDRSMRISSVSPDYHFGGVAATQHLLQLGHRQIVHVTHPHRQSLRRRLDGFREALEEAGIEFSADRHVLDLGDPHMIGINAREIISRMIDENRELPTAFFCVADIVALGVVQAIQAHGLSVPEDVSVMGFDGLSIGAHSSPPLSTVRIDRQELGRTGLKLLLEQNSANKPSAKRVGMGVEVVPRLSTGPAR